MPEYIGPYSPEYYADPEAYQDDSVASAGVLTGLGGLISSIGRTAQGVIQSQQGVVVDQYGRVVSVGGRAVTSYNTSTLSGVIGGMSFTTLLLLGLGVYLLLKAVK